MQYQIQHLIEKLAAKCNNKNQILCWDNITLAYAIGKQPDKQEALEAVLWETQLSLKKYIQLATIAFWGHNQRTLWNLLNKQAIYIIQMEKKN